MAMRAVIHQPYFFPWLGYFSKLAYADVLILLDDVQFRKRHYHDRAKILNMHGRPEWLSLPTGSAYQMPINKVFVKNIGLNMIRRKLSYSYSRAAFYSEEWHLIEGALCSLERGDPLLDINMAFIQDFIKSIFRSKGKSIILSSRVSCSSEPSYRLVELANKFGVKEIIVGTGAALSNKVHDIDLFRRSGISIYVQDFPRANLTYRQIRRPDEGFVGNLSSIDALLNVGHQQVSEMMRHPHLVPIKL